jgi:hypothetical protein
MPATDLGRERLVITTTLSLHHPPGNISGGHLRVLPVYGKILLQFSTERQNDEG